MANGNDNGWKEWSKHILKELERLNKAIERIDKSNVHRDIELATLKVKAGIWGGLAGLIGAVAIALIYIIKTVFK